MKKIFLILSFAGIVSAAFAQTPSDAFRFSENSYEGTARTIAMGNAFTALGGDLGSISINPAGSAVAKYSQVSITPGVTISSSTSIGNPVANTSLNYFEDKMRSSYTTFNMPNAGVTINFNTSKKSGLKNFTIGFIVNKVADYNQDVFASGTNDRTSYLGSMAAWATYDGIPSSQLHPINDNVWNSQNWKYVIGYKTTMIDDLGNGYIGATERDIDNGDGTYDVNLAGKINQNYGRRTSGDKYEYIINAGFNIYDIVFLGFNLTATTVSYSYSDYFMESAVNPEDFLYTQIVYGNEKSYMFDQMKYQTEYRVTGSGISGKFGVIVTPGLGLRFGAAIQTPTLLEVKERWSEYGEINVLGTGGYNSRQESPEGNNTYSLISPFRANFGVAWTFGKFGVISADYELCNYGKMAYMSTFAEDKRLIRNINTSIKETYGISQLLRLGLEVKPLSSFAIRAGYMYSSPAHKDEIELTKGSPKNLTRLSRHALSFGIGYMSKKSFFMDIAAQRTFEPVEYYMPYADYIFESNGTDVQEGYYAPEIAIDKHQWKVMLTLGWRF